MCTTKICKKAGKLLVKPLKWYIRTSARNYENMFGENLQYVRFWM